MHEVTDLLKISGVPATPAIVIPHRNSVPNGLSQRVPLITSLIEQQPEFKKANSAGHLYRATSQNDLPIALTGMLGKEEQKPTEPLSWQIENLKRAINHLETGEEISFTADHRLQHVTSTKIPFIYQESAIRFFKDLTDAVIFSNEFTVMIEFGILLDRFKRTNFYIEKVSKFLKIGTHLDKQKERLEENAYNWMPEDLKDTLTSSLTAHGQEAEKNELVLTRYFALLSATHGEIFTKLYQEVKKALEVTQKRKELLDRQSLFDYLTKTTSEDALIETNLGWSLQPEDFIESIKQGLIEASTVDFHLDIFLSKLIVLVKHFRDFDQKLPIPKQGVLSRVLVPVMQEVLALKVNSGRHAELLFELENDCKPQELRIEAKKIDEKLVKDFIKVKKILADHSLFKKSIDPLVEDLTHHYGTLFKQIDHDEFRYYATIHHSKKFAPNLWLAKVFSDAMTKFVISSIETSKDKQKTHLVENFLHLATKCLEKRNFQAALDIFSGLSDEKVKRWLTHDFELLKNRIDTQNQFKLLRQDIEKGLREGEAIVPIFSFVAHDFSTLQRDNPKKVDGLYNLTRMKRLVNQIEKVEQLKFAISLLPTRKTDITQAVLHYSSKEE